MTYDCSYSLLKPLSWWPDMFICQNNKVKYRTAIISTSDSYHRYRPEIPEPAPSLSRHGASIGGVWVFPAIKITVICQVRMYCGLSLKINTHETPHDMWRFLYFVCVLFLPVWSPKMRISPIGAPRRHYTEQYRSSGISGLYLWYFHIKQI